MHWRSDIIKYNPVDHERDATKVVGLEHFNNDTESQRFKGGPHMTIASATEIIEEAREGRMFILVDNEDRENEGDLVIPAQMATPRAINFMAKFGRGLICLALTSERVKQLGLGPMTANNSEPMGTAFTTSIEARDGVTTGISAADRARTVSAAIDMRNGPEALVSPGHIFPLEAREGGVLVRAGHTEAAVDVAKLAGLNPSGVICEIMKDDGTMARLPDLLEFSHKHGLKVGTIEDLISYRLRHDHLIERITETSLHSQFGGTWTARVYRNKIDGLEHLALIKGPLDRSEPVMVRIHVVASHFDFLGGKGDRSQLLQRSMCRLADAGGGVAVVLSNASKSSLSENLIHPQRARSKVFRSYGVGAQILSDLDIHRVTLLTNSDRMPVSVGGFGIDIVDRVRIDLSVSQEPDCSART